MKKTLLIGLLLLLTSACQSATPTPEPFASPTATLPPTPIPDTPTPEPTLTPTPSPTPLPRFFTEQFDSSLVGWVTLQAGNEATPNLTTKDSALRLQVDSPFAWFYALYSPEEYDNVHIETKLVSSALSPASIGLVCRYSETDGWFEYNISTDGTYTLLLGKWLDTGIAEYLPVIDGSSKDIKQSGDIQHIALTCVDNVLHLYINGNIVRSTDVSTYGLTSGKIGVTASSFENVPVIAVFEFISVSEP